MSIVKGGYFPSNDITLGRRSIINDTNKNAFMKPGWIATPYKIKFAKNAPNSLDNSDTQAWAYQIEKAAQQDATMNAKMNLTVTGM
jgi:hypothetical protein